jgi:membrane-bound lytic murein transglycosylase A
MPRARTPRPVITRTATLALSFVLPLAACQKPEPAAIPSYKKDYGRALPPGALALRKITDPAQLPPFDLAYYGALDGTLEAAIANSLHYLAKPSSQRFFPYGDIDHARMVASLEAFRGVVAEARSPEDFNRIIRERFDTYISVGCDDRGTMLYTGYYCPIFDGSITRTDRFSYPIYKKPAGLEMNPLDPDGKPVGGPWHPRREIESSQMLAGQELVWVADRFEAYVVNVQGSGRIRLPDGALMEIGYAGNNGYEYTSVAKEMIADGVMSAEGLSLDAMIAYFKANPQDLDVYLPRNERFVFFQETRGGPYGCLNEPVLPMRSIATDKEVFPRAGLALLDCDGLTVRPGEGKRRMVGFACDQDRGAAIRAAGRCDLFRGTGDEAGGLAGHTYTEGRLYYLFLKPEYAGGTPMPPESPRPADDSETSGY